MSKKAQPESSRTRSVKGGDVGTIEIKAADVGSVEDIKRHVSET